MVPCIDQSESEIFKYASSERLVLCDMRILQVVHSSLKATPQGYIDSYIEIK